MNDIATPEPAIARSLKHGLLRIGAQAAERLHERTGPGATTAQVSAERIRIARACATSFSTHPELHSGEAIWAIQRVALAAFDQRLAALTSPGAERPEAA